MSDEHPTIPQIVQALTTLKDRQNDTLKAMQAEHEEKMKALKGRFATVDAALLSRDLMVEELERVIATLCKRIERTQEQLKRDNQQCVYSEPLELINLLGTTYESSALIRQARQKAHDAKRLELARQEAEKLSKADQTPCRTCGHIEDRHTEELPEEGGKNYCTECTTIAPFIAGHHTFDGSTRAHWDRCKCGHPRQEHTDSGAQGWYCGVCRPEHGRLHEFVLKM